MERLLLASGVVFVVGMMIFAVRSAPNQKLGYDAELMQRTPRTHPDDEWFTEQVIDSDLPVLVDFRADWCGPCRVLEQVIDSVKKDYKDKFRVVPVDTGEHMDVAMYYHADPIPMVIWFEDGVPVDGFQGLISAKLLRQFIDRNLAGGHASY